MKSDLLFFFLLVGVALAIYLDQFIISPCDKLAAFPGNIHSVDGARLGALQLANHGTIKDFPVADFAVCSTGDHLTLLCTIAHTLEQGIGKHDLFPDKSPEKTDNV